MSNLGWNWKFDTWNIFLILFYKCQNHFVHCHPWDKWFFKTKVILSFLSLMKLLKVTQSQKGIFMFVWLFISDMLGVENLVHTFRHVRLFKIDSVLSSNRHKNTSWNFASFNLSKPLWPDGPWFAALRNTNRHVITVYIKTLSSSLLNQLKLVYWSFGGINMHLIFAPHQPGRKRNVPLH